MRITDLLDARSILMQEKKKVRQESEKESPFRMENAMR